MRIEVAAARMPPRPAISGPEFARAWTSAARPRGSCWFPVGMNRKVPTFGGNEAGVADWCREFRAKRDLATISV